MIFVYGRAWGHTDTTASEDDRYETLQPLRPHCCRRNAATRHVFPMKGVELRVIILPCCLQIEVALNHHIGRGLETKYDDTVRFNWLMWVWYNLPALEIICTFFTSNALRAWISNLLSRNSPFVVTFHLPPWDAQTAWNSAVQVRSRWNFIMLGRNQRWWRRWVRLLKSRLLHNLLPENSGRKEEWMKCAHTKDTTRNKCRTCVGWQVSVSIDVSCLYTFSTFFFRQYLLKSSGCPFPGNDEVE